MRANTILAYACFAGMLCGFPLSPHAVAVPDDLKLDETTTLKMVISPKPNPHEARACTDCHPERPADRPPSLSATRGFLGDDYPDEICLRCHEKRCALNHPPDARTGGEEGMRPPGFLPLRHLGEGVSRVTCMTCHDVHYPHTGNGLLRGYAINPAVQESRFPTRLDFCRACHGEGAEALAPHRRGKADGPCSLCHAPGSGGDGPGELRAGVNRLCTLCHTVLPEPHYLSFNPFPEVAAGNPEGRYTCATCHQPHAESNSPLYLRESYLKTARSSSRINPHGKAAFCQSCHPDSVRSFDQPGPAVLNASDSNRLCNRCHGTGSITGMAHPLGPLAEGFREPDDLPLVRNEITCLTCHTAGHLSPEREGPWFLRGGPYETSRGICGKCHILEAFARLAPHEELRYDRGCEICHLHGDSYPGSPIKVGPPAADDNLLCLRCHEYQGHPANWRHTVRPGIYDYVRVDPRKTPLDRFGRITCHSCHQVHDQKAERSYLRTVRPSGVGTSFCAVCHPY